MVPLILAALGGGLAVHFYHTRKAATTPTATAITAITKAADTAVQAALAQPASAPGQVTPDRVAVHGQLMAGCNDPAKLRRAAALFGHEGLPQFAQALLQKAVMVHEMMHGAKAIVERSRAGDQHAMALAKSIGEQARMGNPRAQLSAFLIQEYTAKNPSPMSNGMTLDSLAAVPSAQAA